MDNDIKKFYSVSGQSDSQSTKNNEDQAESQEIRQAQSYSYQITEDNSEWDVWKGWDDWYDRHTVEPTEHEDEYDEYEDDDDEEEDDEDGEYDSNICKDGDPKEILSTRHKKFGAIVVALVIFVFSFYLGMNIKQNNTVQEELQVSARPVSSVALKEVDGQTELTDAEVYASVVNSVVSIDVSEGSGINIFGQESVTSSSGSGFILTEDGYIMTNQHVISGAENVTVTLYNGNSYDAEIIGSDEDYDVAILKIEESGLQCVVLGDSENLNVGDRVLAIGNPLGELTFSLSGGIVSSVNRTINVEGTPFNVIQTDASLNPGNSGGPLLNMYGEVVGIVSAKYASDSTGSTGIEGLGFAIPMNDVRNIAQEIMTNGFVSNKAYLGAYVGSMTETMAQQYRYDVTAGVFVYSVDEGGAAEQAGLQMGDVITEVDGKAVEDLQALTAVKKKFSAGDECVLTIYRANEKMELTLTWGVAPEEETEEEESVNQNGQNGYLYGTQDMMDFFRYFFG